MIALARLRRRVAWAWRPVERIEPDVWIEQHVRMSDEHEAARGLYDLADRPWWRDVLRAAADPETRTITCPAATQVGKTLALCALILYLARHCAGVGVGCVPGQAGGDRVSRSAVLAGGRERVSDSAGVPVEPAVHERRRDARLSVVERQ